MPNLSPAYEDLGYTRWKSTKTKSVAISGYSTWKNELKKNFRNTLDTTKTYSTENRRQIVADYMQANVRYKLPKYKGTADYGVKWRELERMLMWVFTTVKQSYAREIARSNALINKILADENVRTHIEQYTHVYDAEWIE